MKKTFLFFAYLFPLIVFSQTYHFDYYIEEKTIYSRPKEKASNPKYFNDLKDRKRMEYEKRRNFPIDRSQNSNLYFFDIKEKNPREIIPKSNGKIEKTQYFSNYFYDSKQKRKIEFEQRNDILRASIRDSESGLRHSFKVKKIKDKYLFIYTHTNNFGKRETISDSDKQNVFEVSKLDSLNYKIRVYKNGERKKIDYGAEVTLEKTDADLIEIGFDSSESEAVDNELRKAIGENTNFIIKKNKYSYSTGTSGVTEVEKIEKTNIRIQLPEKLVFKEFDYWGEFSE